MEVFPSHDPILRSPGPLTVEDEAIASTWLQEIIDDPPNPIRKVVIVHGWTLGPESPGWYQDAADFLRRYCGVEVDVLAMPDSSEPNPTAWSQTLDAAVDCPETTLIVGHSLGFITALNWAYGKSEERPNFKLAGLASVAGNIDNVGFEEIRSHFEPVPEQVRRLDQVRQHVGRVVLMYGELDPYVSPLHGRILAGMLGRPLNLLQGEAHFSGVHVTDAGVEVPPCDTSAAITAFLCDMIIASDPKRFPRNKTADLLVLNPQTGEWGMSLWLAWPAVQGADDAAIRRQMTLFRRL